METGQVHEQKEDVDTNVDDEPVKPVAIAEGRPHLLYRPPQHERDVDDDGDGERP